MMSRPLALIQSREPLAQRRTFLHYQDGSCMTVTEG